MWSIVSDIFSPYVSIGERILSVLVVVVVIGVIGVLGFLSFAVFNSMKVAATKTAITKIEKKEIIPAHSTTTFMMVKAMTIPVTTHHPKSYCLRFKIDGRELSSFVKKEFSDSLSVGDKIEDDYGFGRLDGSYIPVKVRLVRK